MKPTAITGGVISGYMLAIMMLTMFSVGASYGMNATTQDELQTEIDSLNESEERLVENATVEDLDTASDEFAAFMITGTVVPVIEVSFITARKAAVFGYHHPILGNVLAHLTSLVAILMMAMMVLRHV